METRFKTLVVGAAVVTLVASVAGCSKKDDVGSAVAISDALPELKVVPAEVEKLTIKNGANPEIAFEKRDGSWMITAPPPSGPADADAVQVILQSLSEVKIKEKLIASASPEDLAGYELTPDKAMHLVVGRGGSTIADLWFGKSGGRGQMVRVGNTKAVWTAAGYSSYVYSKDLKQLRDSEELRAYKAQAAAKKPAEPAASSVTCARDAENESICESTSRHAYACSGEGTTADVEKKYGCERIAGNRFCCFRGP